MPDFLKLETDCRPCQGSGVFRGQSEPKGFSVVCTQCGGSGKDVIEYLPFTGRKMREDTLVVGWSRGSLPAHHRTMDEGIPYADFMNGKFPPNKP